MMIRIRELLYIGEYTPRQDRGDLWPRCDRAQRCVQLSCGAAVGWGRGFIEALHTLTHTIALYTSKHPGRGGTGKGAVGNNGLLLFLLSWASAELTGVSLFKLILINELFVHFVSIRSCTACFTWSRTPGMWRWDGNGGHMFGLSTIFQTYVSQPLLHGSLWNAVQTFMAPRWCHWMALVENGCLLWLETRLAREVNLNENSHIVELIF